MPQRKGGSNQGSLSVQIQKNKNNNNNENNLVSTGQAVGDKLPSTQESPELLQTPGSRMGSGFCLR